jgi:hypothetical protein
MRRWKMSGWNMRGTISCRRARRELQAVLDQLDPGSIGDTGRLSRFMSGRLNKHLEQCRSCREFFQTLGTFAPVLRGQLDEAVADLPAPAFEAVLRSRGAIKRQVPAEGRRAGRAITDILRRILRRLFAPAGRPLTVLRWAALSAAGVLLVSVMALRIHTNYRTRRAIQEQVDKVVELVYGEPLLSGVESALLRAQPTIYDYMDDLSRALESWMEERTSESYLN